MAPAPDTPRDLGLSGSHDARDDARDARREAGARARAACRRPDRPLVKFVGALNVVERVGDTVRRPTGPWSPAVHALLRHLDGCGAPRFLGIDDDGREILDFVDGTPGKPGPSGDEVPFELGRLLRRIHDAQEGFVPPPDAHWQVLLG